MGHQDETNVARAASKDLHSARNHAHNENIDKWCFSWLADAPNVDGVERAALLNNTKWTPGCSISISFLDGDPEVQERVKKAAMQWINLGGANLTFDFRKNTTDTNIRISFDSPGSWSVLGTTCLKVQDLSKPTMNFGWLTKDTPDEELNRVVLHEFGHAIGLVHEHMNPQGGIEWNKDQVIKDLSGPPNNWSLSVIENNMFKTFQQGETNSTPLDKGSIMMYPVPAKWTRNGFSVGLNAQLSSTDINFIKQVYF